MAIDWNKEIKIGGDSSVVLPTKTTMNLLPQQSSSVNVGKIVLLALLALVLLALIGKFGIADRYAAVSARQSELATAQTTYDAVKGKLADYDEVQAEYRSFVGNASDDETLDALPAMQLVASAVEPSATVTAVGVRDTLVTVNVKDISLDNLGRLADTIKAQPMVSDVAVTKAANSDESNVTAMLQITLEGGSTSKKGK